jgi:hypothetical protein
MGEALFLATLEDMERETNNESQADGKRRHKGTTAGAATAIGVVVGVALYSATDSPAERDFRPAGSEPCR